MKYTNPTRRRLALLAVLALACAAPVLAQSDAEATNTASLSTYSSASDSASASATDDEAQTGFTIHKRVDEVNVLFIATDKHGKFVRDLSQTDFSILDDHKPPQSIVNFRRETDLPLHLGLLIDVSGSVHSRFEFEREASISFLQHSI